MGSQKNFGTKNGIRPKKDLGTRMESSLDPPPFIEKSIAIWKMSFKKSAYNHIEISTSPDNSQSAHNKILKG